MLKAIRQLWAIENSWYLVRDVPLVEDDLRYLETTESRSWARYTAYRLMPFGSMGSGRSPRVLESLLRSVKYRPDNLRKPFAARAQACQWVAKFVDWYNHQHRHIGIKFVTPQYGLTGPVDPP